MKAYKARTAHRRRAPSVQSSDSEVVVFKRPSKPTPRKKRCYVMELPGELRNQIYGYVFDGNIRVEMIDSRATCCIKAHFEEDKLRRRLFGRCPETSKYTYIIRYPRIPGKYKRVHGYNTNWKTSVPGYALMLANKQLSEEIPPFLYSTPTFLLRHANKLLRFINAGPARNLQRLTKLQLQHTTYGEPQYYENAIWKAKHANKWLRVCQLAAATFTGLESLDITLKVLDTPFRFSMKEAWLRPVFAFAPLAAAAASKTNPLHLSIRLHSTYTDFALPTDINAWRQIQTAKAKRTAFRELHGAFAEAVRRVVVGWDEESALVEYKGLSGVYAAQGIVAGFNVEEWAGKGL
ncbi:hypothetical protein LTS18_010090 [Coniosporium uncinatum]|uniref:Uncharacterized protein n=1 Tax=Coniosporium uncinatum TaxID=93489 RepID=A0ACC3D033_9PEZI|nr:hypothetical protein LTS18_010090 [Coniosporium uncinatum]